MTTTTFELGAAPVSRPDSANVTGFLPRLLRSWRKAIARQQQIEELARMDAALLLDIGIAEDEIWRVRAREDFMPRAWAERSAGAKAA